MSQADMHIPASQTVPAPPGRFAGKVALITGASDRGIGGAIAERLASEGAAIAMASRHEPKRLIKRLAKSEQGYVFSHCDVTKVADCRAAIDACMEEFGKIDILINNAGVEEARKIEEFARADWQALLEVNLHGAIEMTQQVLPQMHGPSGVIVNIASALALGGCAGFSVYSASKAGLIGFTQSLAIELAPRGIRVVAVAPGLVHTPMIHKHVEHLTPETWAKIQACHPLGMGSPHDVASAVAFLASGDARWITGVTLPLGYTQAFALPTEPFLH
ncbi:MAG TPA: glucose 1-dehydrogenase [Pirellulaceae bacterium]|nr:glucose 1-dehydrogenase [Pirellulaceae bacterium]